MKSTSLCIFSLILGLSLCLKADHQWIQRAPQSVSKEDFLNRIKLIAQTDARGYLVEFHHDRTGSGHYSVGLDNGISLPLEFSQAITINSSWTPVQIVTGNKITKLRKHTVPVIKATQAHFFRLFDSQTKDEAYIQVLSSTLNSKAAVSFFQQRPETSMLSYFQNIEVAALASHGDAIKALIVNKQISE